MRPAPPGGLRAVAGAFAWMQATAMYNRVRQRLLRLREPRYLFGALAGGVYFYFFLFRPVGRGVGMAGPHGPLVLSPAWATDLTNVAAASLALLTILAWLWPGGKARLGFSEAEIAFLFPAPVTRTTLIQLNVLRTQLRIFLSSFLLSVLFRRGSALGGHWLQFAAGIWALLSMLQLHMLALAFTRERLRARGLRPILQVVLLLTVLAVVGLVCGWSMRAVLHWPPADTLADGKALATWFSAIAGAAPLTWLLTPFRWVVAPLFAADTRAFVIAMGPVLALLLGHYLWAVRVQVAFEEATIAWAHRRAKALAAMRGGRIRDTAPTRPRGEPFRLAGTGFVAWAFLWKELIALGPMFRLRTWMILAVVTIVLCQWLVADPARAPALTIVTMLAMIVGTWSVLMGPMLFGRRLQRMLEELDILKAAPLRGWQIVLGRMLAPIAALTGMVWLALLVGLQFTLADHGGGGVDVLDAVAMIVAAALLAPPMLGLMLSVPFAGMLYFPAWLGTQQGRAGGVEVMGQRLIFLGGYLLTMMLCTIPAALVGGIGYLLGHWLQGPALAFALALLLVLATTVFELACMVDMLGRRLDRFDVARELR